MLTVRGGLWGRFAEVPGLGRDPHKGGAVWTEGGNAMRWLKTWAWKIKSVQILASPVDAAVSRVHSGDRNSICNLRFLAGPDRDRERWSQARFVLVPSESGLVPSSIRPL